MPAEALTDLAIRKLAPRSGERFEVFDSKVPGFAVRVFPSGLKSFVVFCRAGGRQQRLTLGRYPIVSLAEARQLALDALNKVAHGVDPQRERKASQIEHRFADVVEEFVSRYCSRHNRQNTAKETARLLRSRFVATWGDRDVRAISKADVLRVLDGAVDSGAPSAANHALSAIRKFFNWCIDRGILETSPCARVTRPAPVVERDRVLNDAELGAVWRAAGSVGYPYGCIVRLLIATAQRRGEATGLKWSELDFEAATWSIPAERTKNKRPHALPLNGLALSVLKALPKTSDEFVFPARGNDTANFSGFSKAKRELDALSGVHGYTLHDLRRTAATGMAGLGVAPHVIERILNHVSGTFGGVAGIYNRFEYLAEMRAAFDLWARHVDAIAADTTCPPLQR